MIELLPEPPSIDAERGTLIHTILEDLFDLPAPERTLDSATTMAPSRWADQVKQKPELSTLVLNEKEWLDRVGALLKNYFILEKTRVIRCYSSRNASRTGSDKRNLPPWLR